MFEIIGKYNKAKVMIDVLDSETHGQILNFLNNPSFADTPIVIMPDAHKGSGSCIGFTMPMNGRIIPDIVGVDIGCGMLSTAYSIPREKFDVQKFDAYVKEHIPAGFSIHNIVLPHECFYATTAVITEQDVCRVGRSLGTLGGGNHFIEAGYDSKGTLWVTIHSGSRNFGLKVAQYWGRKAKEFCEKNKVETKGMPFLYVSSEEGQGYLRDMRVAQSYATRNRMMMSAIINEFFDVGSFDIVESIHNFIDDTGMIRKGATPAKEGQMVIIPFNMRDGLAICHGKGNPDWNFSAPHGAGRVLSRSKAKSTLDVEYFQEDMKAAGVYTSTANASTLDESPDAYKDKDLIISCIQDTVEIVDFVKPVYNFKASSD